jgi:hypothetical protein
MQDRHGYGRLWAGKSKHDGKKVFAHRIAYEIHKGAIPEGTEIDHLCRMTCCVNPDHLEAVPHRINILRGKTWGARNASVTHCPEGHAYDGANTRWRYGKRSCRTCTLLKDRARYPAKYAREKARRACP